MLAQRIWIFTGTKLWCAGPRLERARRQPAARSLQGLGAQAGGGEGVNYREYVIAAYAVFAAVLAWDYIASRLDIARQLRAARRLAARRQSRTTQANTELQQIGRASCRERGGQSV